MEDLRGALEVEALSRPVVQGVDAGAQLLRGDLRQVGAFGQVLAQQDVGVLVGSPLPGVVGMGEEDGQAQLAFELDGAGELAAVIQTTRDY